MAEISCRNATLSASWRQGDGDSGEAARGMLLSGNRGIPARRERTLRECGREGLPVLRSSTRGENMG